MIGKNRKNMIRKKPSKSGCIYFVSQRVYKSNKLSFNFWHLMPFQSHLPNLNHSNFPE
jgi:hypothetical protein